MSNPLKYSTSTPTGALRHDTLGAGVVNAQYDENWNSGATPNSLTSYYLVFQPVNGIATRVYAPANAAELIKLAQSKGSTETTEAGALAWLSDNAYYPANKVLDNIVTDDLALNLDSRTATSYPRSGTNWLDLSGEGNDSSLINSPTFNSNGYLEFDGTDDYCSIPNSTSLQNTSNLTLEAWVKLDTNVGYYVGIIGKGTSDANEEYCILILPSTGKLYMDVGAGGGPYVNAGYAFALDTWYHIAGTHERVGGVSTIKVYVNGVYQPSTTNGSTNTPNSNTTAVTIGSRFSTGGNPWPGGIAKVGIYTQTLTAAEVFQNYFQGPILTDDLVFAVDAGNLVSFEPGTTAAYNLTGSFAVAAGDGVLTNGVGFSNTANGAWDFDGVDDKITLPNDLGYSTTSVSVFAWYKINGTPGNGYHIICGDSALEMSIHSSATFLRNGVQTTNGRFVSNNGNQTLNDGNYHYYGFTFDGSTKTAYIDGVAVGTQSVTGTLITSFSSRKLGAFGGGYQANGNMTSYLVWDKVLTALEIQQNYNANIKKYT